MSRSSTASIRITALCAILSAPLAYACLVLALAATGYDLDALGDPHATQSGAHAASLVRGSMIFDALGYYLLVAPAVLYVDRALRRVDAELATLLTACGLGYVLVGAIGATVLAAVCPPLMVALEHASEIERPAIEWVLSAALDGVHGGLWNLLEMILGAAFWGGAGALLWRTQRRFAALSIVLGVSAALDALGEAAGSATLAAIGLSVYLVLAPLWTLVVGLLASRELVGLRGAVVALTLLAGCEDYRVCAAPDPAQLDAMPSRLSETGLYDDIASETLADGVRAYRPTFELWTDGAAKRRWMFLPEGAVIDTRDMDAWRFPEGTRLWKEFTRDGVRVETRMLAKIGPEDDDWVMVTYLWNDDGTDAERIADAVVDARGTAHDVPAASQCAGCHGGRASRVLGVSAIQLAHEADEGDEGDEGDEAEWTLARLADAGRLSHVPEVEPVVPGDELTREVLGYLHANCGHCHNRARPALVGPRCFDPQNDLDFWLRTDALGTVEETPTWRTIGGVIRRGDADHSVLVIRAERRGAGRMPPLGTEEIDERAMRNLRAWIDGL